MHQLMSEAAWLGELASLHPLFVGGPVAAAAAVGWTVLRRRGGGPRAGSGRPPG
jgi:hypothetical protein